MTKIVFDVKKLSRVKLFNNESFKHVPGMLIALGLLGIFLIIMGGLITKNNTPHSNSLNNSLTEQHPVNKSLQDSSQIISEEEYLEKKLIDMLSQVKGAGKVEATICLETSAQSLYMINTTDSTKTTQEHDQNGGSRVITEESENGELVLVQGQNGQEPILRHEIRPQIAGVLVVAEGASDSAVKAELFKSAQVLLGVEPQKIIVMAMERR